MAAKERKFSAGIWYLGAVGDRFAKQGYREDRTIEERYRAAAGVKNPVRYQRVGRWGRISSGLSTPGGAKGPIRSAFNAAIRCLRICTPVVVMDCASSSVEKY